MRLLDAKVYFGTDGANVGVNERQIPHACVSVVGQITVVCQMLVGSVV